ncbi:MAG: carboxypeptidase-like regulatory domain-containing protein, partial [Thermoanaerobaculia bacterium]
MYVLRSLVVLVALSVAAAPQKNQNRPKTTHQGGVPVQVIVTTDGARPASGITNAYVALVPRDAPSRRPARELISPNGIANFTVPPGNYLLMAAADGLQTDFRKTIVVRRRTEPITVNLAPEFEVSGSVTDAEGRPIRNARIAHASVVPPASIGTLSLMALMSFGPRLQTTTNANGAWQLAVAPDKRAALLVEAPGYAPAWVMYDPQEQQGEINVALPKGSSLKAKIDRTDPDVVIGLVATNQDEQSVPATAQTRVWGRNATGSAIRWDSLAPGEYRIVAMVPDPTRFAADKELGLVTLVEGQTAEVTLALPPAPAPQEPYAKLFVPATTSLPGLRTFAKKGSGGASEVAHSIEPTVGGIVIYI